MSRFIFATALAAFFIPSFASPALPALSPLVSKRAACAGNTATTRSEWCDYSLETDYSIVTPDTGVTREYWFELTDVTVSPDGYKRSAIAINGSIPGPTIVADWGKSPRTIAEASFCHASVSSCEPVY